MDNIIETIKKNISDDVVIKKFYFVRSPENKIYCMVCNKTYKKEKSMIDHLIKDHNIFSSDEFKEKKNIMINQEIQEHFALCNNFLTYDNIRAEIEKVKKHYEDTKENFLKHLTKSTLMAESITWSYDKLCKSEARYIIIKDYENFVNKNDEDSFKKHFNQWFSDYKESLMKRIHLNNSTSSSQNIYQCNLYQEFFNYISNIGFMSEIKMWLTYYEQIKAYWEKEKNANTK